jgi:hypothetical protein
LIKIENRLKTDCKDFLEKSSLGPWKKSPKVWREFDYIVFGFLEKRNHQKTKCLLKFDKDWKQIENRLKTDCKDFLEKNSLGS